MTTLSLGKPSSKPEIVAALSAEFPAVHAYFQSIPAAQFTTAATGVWTPADNLDHLIRSCSPLIAGLKLPKVALRLRYGKAKHRSRTFAQVRSDYVDGALASGGQASGSYLPKHSNDRDKLLAKWHLLRKPMVDNLASWSEKQLDSYQAAHPLLGNMTVRELLFFTLYHNMHHVNDVQRLRNQPQTEWF